MAEVVPVTAVTAVATVVATANTVALQRFFDRCAQSLRDGQFERLVLAGPGAALLDLQRVSARRIELQGQPQLSLVYSHPRRDLTRNLPLDEALQQLRALLGPRGFGNAHLHTAATEVQLACSRKGRWSLREARRDPPQAAASAPPEGLTDTPEPRPSASRRMIS